MKMKSKINIVQLIIPAFIVLMIIMLVANQLSVSEYITLSLRRTCMLLVMVLAVTPTIYSGVGINYGVTVGFVCGLAGAVLGISTGLTGIPLMLACIFFSLPFGLVAGIADGFLLNQVRGAEDLIATYAGYAFVAFGSIIWVMLKPSSEVLRFANGDGIRVQVALDGLFKDKLTYFLSLKFGKLELPIGFFLIGLAFCGVFALFMRSTMGLKIKVVGHNPTYATAIGLNVNHNRMISVVVSTLIATVGICFYAQTFGFYEFYSNYLQLGFTCVAGVLIGGASGLNVSMWNVIYGCFLYETILTISTPVANKMIPSGSMPEIIRLLVTNGVILYALTKQGGNENE